MKDHVPALSLPLGARCSMWLLALLGLGAGCATPGAPLPDSVKDPARRAYYQGMRELADGDYVAATTLFQAVAASPRHVKYAALAKLRLGDALFFQGRYAEATEIFRGFVQQHNADPNMPYARFKVGECYYERLPGEWFASPPAHEFDQTVSTQTEAELKSFLTSFPTSVYAPRARKMLAEARQMLFRHEMYAVDFYEDRDKWQAVAWRLRDVIDTYPELGLKDGLVWRLSVAWDKVGDRAETQRALGLYLSSFPSGEHSAAAKARLEAIQKALEAEKKPDDKPPAPAPEEAPPEEPEVDLEDLKLKPPELPELPE
jgi:outer membrane protein assembly factor BamD